MEEKTEERVGETQTRRRNINKYISRGKTRVFREHRARAKRDLENQRHGDENRSTGDRKSHPVDAQRFRVKVILFNVH